MAMEAKAGKKARGPRFKGDPTFMNKSELAHEMGDADTATIDQWVREGSVPPPHSQPGKNTAVWRREHFRFYVERGYWPPESFPSGTTADGE